MCVVYELEYVYVVYELEYVYVVYELEHVTRVTNPLPNNSNYPHLPQSKLCRGPRCTSYQLYPGTAHASPR